MRMNMIAGLVVAVLCMALPSPAATYYHLTDDVTTVSGSAVSGASVYVYTPNTTTTVTAYSDIAGTEPVTWPVYTDANGEFSVYLTPGVYDVRIVHSGHAIDTTKDNYMVGSGSDTLSFNSLDLTGDISAGGTISANAFDADDWITAGGQFTGQTLETSGLMTVGTTLETGGTITVGGDIYVASQAWISYNETNEVYDFRLNNNYARIRPELQVNNNILGYGNIFAYGKLTSPGKVYADIVQADTLKPQLGRTVNVRAADGQNDAIMSIQFLQFNPVDISVSMPDTSDFTRGALFFAETDSKFYYMTAPPKAWNEFAAAAAVVPGEDAPDLVATPTSLTFDSPADPDSVLQTVALTNAGDGRMTWTLTAESYDWLAVYNYTDGAITTAADTGTVEDGNDSLAVVIKWAEVAAGASKNGTLTLTGGGGATVTVRADGEAIVGEDYVVEPNHPRLFFNEDELATVRAKCNSAESDDFTAFIGNVDLYLAADFPLEASGSPHLNTNATKLTRFAFAAIATQDTTYMNLARNCIDSMIVYWPTTWYDDTDAIKGLSQFYDWCYPYLGTTQKAYYGGLLGEMCEREHLASNYSTNAAHSQIVVMAPMMYPAMAVYGDGYADTLAAAALDSIYAHTFGPYHMGAILDSIGHDGGSYEGMDYGDPNGESTLLWMWDHGTQSMAVDPWAELSNIAGWGDYMLYNVGAVSEVTPSLYGFGSSKMADDHYHASGRGDQHMQAVMFANAYQDSAMVWLANEYVDQTGAYINTYERWERIVYKDTVLVESDVPNLDTQYPNAKRFDLAAVFMREGWDLSTASTDVWATYRHTQYPWGHSSADAGAFVMGRGHDLLFIESGEYNSCDNTHHSEYARRTIASNCITVKLVAESFDGHENDGGQTCVEYGCGLHPLTVGTYTDSMAGRGNRGKITDYEYRADTLAYTRSNLTPAYHSDKADSITREFAWLEEHDTFLIFDYVDCANDSTSLLQKSLFHTINNPTEVTDDEWTVVHGTSEATLNLYGHDHSDEVGGSGAEFMVNGTNYPSTRTSSDRGAYRIEAVMPRDVEERWLLSVIRIGDVGSSDTATLTYVEVGDYIGAAVNGDTLLFSTTGGTYDYRAAP